MSEDAERLLLLTPPGFEWRKAMWKAVEALNDTFAPLLGEPAYRFNFKLTIIQQTRHRITVAANSENDALRLAISEASQTSRWPRWLAPLAVLAHERSTENLQLSAIERLPPRPPDDDLLWPSIMP
jgi:hypothetical protein